ncbi:MAG: polyribonucleotide nucleotidyltransferase [Chloroflexi bacterium]|nr:polyribonucleotide nucleotidyltransferase [Chloroflexota bacterium]
MDTEYKRYTVKVADKEFIIETGHMALLANGAVTVRVGDSMVLATATASKEPREDIDFFPLSVEYEERLYAAGRIPGSWFRREGRPGEGAILLARLVDRPLRPLFPKGFRNDVQVIITSLSSDEENLLDIPAIVGASAALTISDIPWNGPIGAVRVGYIDGEFVINPTASQLEKSILDLRVAGTEEAIIMVESGANEVPEDLMIEALKRAHEAMQPLIELQKRMREEIGREKMEVPLFQVPEEVKKAVEELAADRINDVLHQFLPKKARTNALDAIRKEVKETLTQQAEEKGETIPASYIKTAFEEVLKTLTRKMILEEGVRPDGRDYTTIRPLKIQVGILPRTHGSGLFQRGETQVLTIATLGTPREAQELDTLFPEETKRYIHHYNFPPYSTGEVWPMRGPKRREIGHGALAERALEPMIPPQEEFPYTIRLVSEVLTSNGSTSMASVCGSTLALMDAGVPIKAPVAGIAMGLITDQESGRYAILTDIQGMEDMLGDMDFKVAGTRDGITALQMDIKIAGLSYDILSQALAQARDARLYILDRMLEVIPEPRPELSPYAPRIEVIKIDPLKIGRIIGPGGKVIRKMQEEYNVKIDISEDGTVYIASHNKQDAEAAIREIETLTKEAHVGEIFTGRVVRVEPYGAFVEILPGIEGLVHISQLADYRVPSVEDVVKIGDELMVMVIDVDKDTGKIRLSRQAVLEGWSAEEARAKDRKLSGGRSGSRGGRSSGGRSGGDRRGRRSGDRSRRSRR